MNRYDNEYYIVHEPEGEEHVFPMASKNTASRKYTYKKNDRISEPFIFYNGDKASDNKKNFHGIILDGVNLIISKNIRESIAAENTIGLQYNDSIYIDNDAKWHENLWYLTFYQKSFYLDVVHSEALRGDLSTYGHNSSMTINKYSLDSSMLDNIPLAERLLFKIGGTSLGYVFIHESLVVKLSEYEPLDIRFFKVADFEEGDQY